VRLGIVDFLITALNIPFTPRGNNLHFRSKVHNRKLKTDLIVALACAAVANSVCVFGLSNFNKSLCDYGSRKACTEEITLIICTRLHGRNYIIINELVCQIFNVKL